MYLSLYVPYVVLLTGGVPRMGPRVPFALLPLDIFILNKKVNIPFSCVERISSIETTCYQERRGRTVLSTR